MSKEEKRLQMLSMIADWQRNGKSKKHYCEDNGIKEATFYCWFSRSKEDDASSGRFIAIDKSCEKRGEVIYRNGVRVKPASIYLCVQGSHMGEGEPGFGFMLLYRFHGLPQVSGNEFCELLCPLIILGFNGTRYKAGQTTISTPLRLALSFGI